MITTLVTGANCLTTTWDLKSTLLFELLNFRIPALLNPPQEKGTVLRCLEVMSQKADHTMEGWPNSPVK